LKYVTLLIIVLLSVNIHAQEKSLKPPFFKQNKIQLYYTPSSTGGNDLAGALVTPAGKKIALPARCQPEGGDAQLGNIYTLTSPANLLILNCLYQINHSGLGIKGTDHRALVFEDNNGELQQRRDLEKLISGYEGSSEDGSHSYFFYDDMELATLKLQHVTKNLEDDSLHLTHKVVIKRLKKHDINALTYYISDKRVTNLIKQNPISPKNANLYNDIGFALAEIGNVSEALKLLYAIEVVVPKRTVLMLNLADTLWDSGNKSKSKDYYLKYKIMMQNQSKGLLIPSRVDERIKY
jgi:hypothetical protein